MTCGVVVLVSSYNLIFNAHTLNRNIFNKTSNGPPNSFPNLIPLNKWCWKYEAQSHKKQFTSTFTSSGKVPGTVFSAYCVICCLFSSQGEKERWVFTLYEITTTKWLNIGVLWIKNKIRHWFMCFWKPLQKYILWCDNTMVMVRFRDRDDLVRL